MSEVQERPASTGRGSRTGKGQAVGNRTVKKTTETRKTSLPKGTEKGVNLQSTKIDFSTISEADFQAQDTFDNVVIREIKIRQKRKRVKNMLLLKLGAVFVLGLLVVFRFASITQMGYKVSEEKQSYEEVVEENERLKVNIKSRLNINELTGLAKERLEMQQPQTYQMVVLNTQPADQTEVYNVELEKEPDARAWYTKVYDFFREFLGLI